MSEDAGERPARECSVRVNTHPFGFTLLVFFISMLWFRVNGQPVFPLGYIIALLVAKWHSDIEEAIYGKSRFVEMAVVGIAGMLIGFLLR